ncbi:phospholipase domain-containing protein [Pedobacter panaciterrae]
MLIQEKGIRSSCALPYELYVDGGLSEDKTGFEINFMSGNRVFDKKALGSPFTVSVPVKYNDEITKDEISRNWSFAVSAGDHLNYSWPVNAFESDVYHLRIHGPNGFYREFIGNKNNPQVRLYANYEHNRLNPAKLTGNIKLDIVNNGATAQTLIIIDNSYGKGRQTKLVAAGSKTSIVLDLSKSYHWYDISVKLQGNDVFEERFAGRVESGIEAKTDP